MNKLMMAGAVLALLGILGFAVPYFTTNQTEDVAKLGDMKLTTTTSTSHSIPPIAAGGLLILGIVLLGGGLIKRT